MEDWGRDVVVEVDGTTHNPTERADRVVQHLRAQGERITTSRRVIIELLASTDEHLTVEGVADRVQEVHPEIHLSTVYRTLETLEQWGVVEHVHRGHAPPIHHLADAHPHLVCETCGRVADIPVAMLEDLTTRLRDEFGFELHATHFALMGECDRH
jgi:Fur family ferric uptake transcriptional regulator